MVTAGDWIDPYELEFGYTDDGDVLAEVLDVCWLDSPAETQVACAQWWCDETSDFIVKILPNAEDFTVYSEDEVDMEWVYPDEEVELDEDEEIEADWDDDDDEEDEGDYWE